MCQKHSVLHSEKQNLARETLFISNAVQHLGYGNAPAAFLELLRVVLATKSHFYQTVTRSL